MQVNLQPQSSYKPGFGSIVKVGKSAESALQAPAITRICEKFDGYTTDIISRLKDENCDFAIRCNGKDKLDFRILEESISGANAFARSEKGGWIGFTVDLPGNKADLMMAVEDACSKMHGMIEKFLGGNRSSGILEGREAGIAKKANRLVADVENLQARLDGNVSSQRSEELVIDKLVDYAPKPNIDYEIISQ